MKTWRERIAEARNRGHFTPEDAELAAHWNTCLVGEVAATYGWEHDQGNFENRYLDPLVQVSLPEFDEEACLQICDAVKDNNFDLAEKLLNLIEDTALGLKRKIQ